jgi:hypothetical protein
MPDASSELFYLRTFAWNWRSGMKVWVILLVNVVFCFSLLPVFAQIPGEGMGSKIAEVCKNNAALIRQYTWSSKTELIEKDNLKDIRIDRVSYGADGQVKRTLLNDFGAPLPLGFLRRSMAEADRQKAEKYMIGMEKFLDQYTLPAAGKVVEFLSKAKIPPSDAGGMLKLIGSSVVVPGDTLSLWVEATTLHTTRMEVSTFFEGDIVVVSSMFKTPPNGPTYMAYAIATITVKQLKLQVHNYDYTRIEPPSVPPIQERQLSPSIVEMEIKDPALSPATSPPPVSPAPKVPSGETSLPTVEQRLRDLKSLLDKGLITQSDYDSRKAQLLKDM